MSPSPCNRINSNLVFFMIMPALCGVNKIQLKQVSKSPLDLGSVYIKTCQDLGQAD